MHTRRKWMLYLQNNWIYCAFAAVIGCFAIFSSIWFVLLGVGLAIFCFFRISKRAAIVVSGTLFLFMWMVSERLPVETIESQQLGTVTSLYKQQGDRFAAFIKVQEGPLIYVSYTLPDEETARVFKETNWTGIVVALELERQPERLQSHPFEFQFDDYLLSKGAQGAYKALTLQPYSPTTTLTWQMKRKVSSIRLFIQQSVVTKVPVELQDEVLALTIGDRSLGDQDTNRLYQRLGLSHLFAISGLHIALLTGALYGVLLAAGVRLRMIYILILSFLPFYMVLAGGAPSVIRACFMVFIGTVLLMKKIKVTSPDLISWVLLITLAYFPFFALQPGYQLSFIAVFSLIYSTKLMASSSYLLSTFFTTVICQLAVLPIVLYHFQQLSLISFVINILAIPLFTFLILPVSFFYVLCAILPINFLPFVDSYTRIRSTIQLVFQWFSELPFVTWTPPALESYFLITLGVCIMTFLLWERRGVLALPFILVVSIGWHVLPYFKDQAKLSFVYVGQGDSTFIQLPNRDFTLLIDAGGRVSFEKEPWQERDSYEIGRSIVSPYIRSFGVSTIDLFILTHADADHTEGAEELVEDFHVRQILVPVGVLELPELEQLRQSAEAKKVPIYEIEEAVSIQIGDSRIYVLPVEGPYKGNDSSLVTVVEVFHQKIVLPGDLEKDGEQWMVSRYGELLMNADLLKLGHHGSKTSTTPAWLDVINPKYTVASAGKDNRYGHPHEEVLKELVARQIPIRGTYEGGTIEVIISRKGVEWKTNKKDAK